MARIWYDVISPKYLHDNMGVYNGIWMPQMDRCWNSDDGFQVMSRLLRTDWGKVEHVVITRLNGENILSFSGERDIPWAVKQEIKNELFGDNRLAIEVFPKKKALVDVLDCYHLWVFPKDFDLPFGIHPTKDKQGKCIPRGCLPVTDAMVENVQKTTAHATKINREQAVDALGRAVDILTVQNALDSEMK